MRRSLVCVLQCLFFAAILENYRPNPVMGVDKKGGPKPPRDADVNAFFTLVDKSQTPEAALLALNGYLAANELTEKQAGRAKKQLEKYSQYAKDGLRRHGGKWRTAEEINQLRTQADDYIRLAFDELKAQNPKKTLQNLDRASLVDPGGIRADFIVGMLYCLRGSSNPKLAAERFETVLKRVPNYGPARNNLAICKIKLLTGEKFGEAYANFRKAGNSLAVCREGWWQGR